jgi:hypothetical protein
MSENQYIYNQIYTFSYSVQYLSRNVVAAEKNHHNIQTAENHESDFKNQNESLKKTGFQYGFYGNKQQCQRVQQAERKQKLLKSEYETQ